MSNIVNINTAIKQYQNPNKQLFVKSVEEILESAPWMNRRANIDYASATDFENEIDFLVNIPELQKILEDENITKEWHWESFSSSGLEDIFTNEQIVNLLNNEREIEIGWILRKTYGRIDEDCTYVEYTYLLKTKLNYYHILIYQETLH